MIRVLKPCLCHLATQNCLRMLNREQEEVLLKLCQPHSENAYAIPAQHCCWEQSLAPSSHPAPGKLNQWKLCFHAVTASTVGTSVAGAFFSYVLSCHCLNIVMLAVPWSAATFLAVWMLLSLTYYGKALPTPAEQETDLSWFSSDYQNHLIWEKDNQNKILHNNQKIWSCNAALWKKKKKKRQERMRKQSRLSLCTILGNSEQENCVFVSVES